MSHYGYAIKRPYTVDDKFDERSVDLIEKFAVGSTLASSSMTNQAVELYQKGFSLASIAKTLETTIASVEKMINLGERYAQSFNKLSSGYQNLAQPVLNGYKTNQGLSVRKRGIDGVSPLAGINQRQKALCLRLGKDENGTRHQRKSISNMLKKACGNSTAYFEFNGYMASKQGQRATTFMCFRHNIGSDATPHAYTSVGDANLAKLGILTPVAGDVKLPGFENLTGPSGDINDLNPYHVHEDLSTWFHPMGRSKFEDTAWNMNKLKHINNAYLGTTATSAEDQPTAYWMKVAAINDDVTFAPGEYARTSHIYSNNINSSDTLVDTAAVQKYQQNNYNMVFNSGSVTYNFCNKGDGPAQCEIIVYKVKRQNTFLSHALSDYIQKDGTNVVNLAHKGIPKFLHPPIEEGVKEQYKGKALAGTIGGDEDPNSDMFTHPGKKLYPQSRYTRQSALPYKEVQRVPFTMISGGRRTVQLKFGGDVYDPANVPQVNNSSSGIPAESNRLIPILDEHSYIVCLSFHGVNATRVYGSDNDRLGDIYAAARLEWKASYVESIGAAQFNDGNTKLRMNGRTHKFPGSEYLIGTDDTPANQKETASVILPLNDMIRTSNGDASVKLDGKQGTQPAPQPAPQPATIPWTVRDYWEGTSVVDENGYRDQYNLIPPDPGWASATLYNPYEFRVSFSSPHNGIDYYDSTRLDTVPDPSVKWVEWGTAPYNTWVNVGWNHTKVKPNPLYVGQGKCGRIVPLLCI